MAMDCLLVLLLPVLLLLLPLLLLLLLLLLPGHDGPPTGHRRATDKPPTNQRKNQFPFFIPLKKTISKFGN